MMRSEINHGVKSVDDKEKANLYGYAYLINSKQGCKWQIKK